MRGGNWFYKEFEWFEKVQCEREPSTAENVMNVGTLAHNQTKSMRPSSLKTPQDGSKVRLILNSANR